MNYVLKYQDFILEKVLTTPEFIKLANEKYNKLYNYAYVKITGLKDPIRIICKTHGPFNVTPAEHLKGKGCPDCHGQDQPSKIANKQGYDVLTGNSAASSFYEKKPKLTNNMIRRN